MIVDPEGLQHNHELQQFTDNVKKSFSVSNKPESSYIFLYVTR